MGFFGGLADVLGAPLKLGSGILHGIGSAFGGGGTATGPTEGGNVSPEDVFSIRRNLMGQMGGQEMQLSSLQNQLAMMALQSALGMPGLMPAGLDLNSIAAGQIPQASQENINTIAYGGVQQGLNQAYNQAENAAASRGIPMSSIQFQMQNELTRPLLSEAAQTAARLNMAEVQRLNELRQRELANRLAMQQSPALDWLRQQRSLETTQFGQNLNRFPGGLPEWTYPGANRSPFAPWGGA